MGKESVMQRMLAAEARVGMGEVRTGRIQDSSWPKLINAAGLLSDAPLYIDDTSALSPFEIRARARRLKAKLGSLDCIMIDYLQLMRGSSRRPENRVQEISEIARTLKTTARLLKVPVIALSQLSRAVENREDKRPQLSDIRESGSIEAEADIVMMLYRDSYYKAKEENRREVENFEDVETAEVIIAKHRNGPTGVVKLGFQPAFARYRNLKHADE
jgi:replicative DNA helicase